MTSEQYFTKLSFNAVDRDCPTGIKSSHTGAAGDRCVLLTDVLKYLATLRKYGIEVTIGDDEQNES